MTKMRSILCFSTLVILAFGVNAQAGGDAVAFGTSQTTTSQAGVFAAFLSRVHSEDADMSSDTAISVSNNLSAPAGELATAYAAHKDTSGTIEFYLWRRDGTALVAETGPGFSGNGLDAMGKLGPGQTYTVLLSELMSEITGLAVGDTSTESEFTGYGWVIGNFDAIAGTYSVTIFGLGFTQNFELTPVVGEGGTLLGGIQLEAPSE